MSRIRQIYSSDVLYVGPFNGNCNSAHSDESISGNLQSAISGNNLINQLFRVQSINYNYSKQLSDVNQFGELAAIDRIPLNAPTVELNFSYLLSNLINEKLLGLNVNVAGDTRQITCISGILANQTDSKNFFIKTVSEGQDNVNNSQSTYNVVSIGNCYLNSYTSRGAVNTFPTVDVSFQSLNIQAQSVNSLSGSQIPTIDPIDVTPIIYGYVLPDAESHYSALDLDESDASLSVLRPGKVSLNFGMGAGDGFFDESDLKVQNYEVSFSLNRQDIGKLGAEYYIKKLPSFPVLATMNINAIVGEFQTGNLVRIMSDNKSFNPTITLKAHNSTNTIAVYQLRGAKLDNQDITSNIGANKLLNFKFSTQIGSANQNNIGLFMSGISISTSNNSEDWGFVYEASNQNDDWGVVLGSITGTENWGSVV